MPNGPPVLTAIAVTQVSALDLPRGIERPGPFLVAPSETGGWALAAWDGESFYDTFSGAVLRPVLCAALPPAGAAIEANRSPTTP